MSENETTRGKDFIRETVDKDLEDGRFQAICTRFPPEPNGYMHIGHAKAFNISFSIADEYNGKYNLRFDDTDPTKEKEEFVESIQSDIKWMGYDWGDNLFYASDYFDQLYEWAVKLIKDGKAYVCDLNDEEMKEYRGTAAFDEDGKRVTAPGKNSPYRDRSVEENLELFEKMKNGEFPDGAKTLRAKIDMAHPNLNMRDPVMYRILRATHYRQGDKWCIYPTYDWTHGQSDSIEGISHSICDVSFENHRPLYDWYLEQLGIHHPRQIEFGLLNITYTILSKRFLRPIVEGGHVSGWDDPRMPTLGGLRRRGYTPTAIKDFLNRIGIAKAESRIDYNLLEHCLRDEQNKTAPRRMAVLDPLKVVITNYESEGPDELDAVNNPEDESEGTRKVLFSKEIYIEREDFMEEPVRKFKRLSPGVEVRLRYANFITCTDVIRDENGNITELHCTYDPETRGGDAPDGRKVKGTIHWVSAEHGVKSEVRLYDHLFTKEDPSDVPEGGGWMDNLNADSLTVIEAVLEPSLAEENPGFKCQFERTGYFCMDPDSTSEKPVYNRTTSLRDSWKKKQKQ